jgi:type II secretory pathway component PulM
MNPLSDSLASLSTRERNLLAAGAVVALVIVLYSLAWRPWQDELNRLRVQVPEKEQTLAWMKAQSAQIRSLVGSAKATSAESGLPLLTTIERSANQVAIRKAITRMSPGDKDNQVRIWMDNADFDVWLRWLQTLKTRGIEVVEVNIDRSAEGKVNIRATLQR